jgi:hypothetical protein
MVYEVPASRASLKQNLFEFKVPGEKKTRSLPLMQFTPLGYRSKLEAAARPIKAAQDAGQDPATDDLRVLGSLQLEMLEKYSPGLTDVMDDEQMGALLKAWQEASRISVGESRALPSS